MPISSAEITAHIEKLVVIRDSLSKEATYFIPEMKFAEDSVRHLYSVIHALAMLRIEVSHREADREKS